MDAVRYLARQGTALRGHDYVDDNLTQLLLLLSKNDDDDNTRKRLVDEGSQGRKLNKYTHSDFQNEILTLMSK